MRLTIYKQVQVKAEIFPHTRPSNCVNSSCFSLTERLLQPIYPQNQKKTCTCFTLIKLPCHTAAMINDEAALLVEDRADGTAACGGNDEEHLE